MKTGRTPASSALVPRIDSESGEAGRIISNAPIRAKDVATNSEPRRRMENNVPYLGHVFSVSSVQPVG
jgi:hypothetical protein